MELNLQPQEAITSGEFGELSVVGVWETIQGEGPLVGTPCVFVRLAGCNLQCPLCDTDYTTGRKLVRPPVLLEKVQKLRKYGLVVITGGEPFRQHLTPFVQELVHAGYQVQIETNGTLYSEDFPWDRVRSDQIVIVCSPKTQKINFHLMSKIAAMKYVVQAGHTSNVDGLPTSVLGMPHAAARPEVGFTGHIFISPLDEQDEAKNKANVQEAVKSCLKFGYRLSLQIHKLIGVE